MRGQQNQGALCLGSTRVNQELVRPRLVARLARAAERGIAIVLGPGGSGKTTLVNQYLAVTGTDPVRVTLSATGGYRESVRALADAIALRLPAMHHAAALALEHGEGADIHAHVEWLLAYLQQLPAQTTIVLDDLDEGFARPHFSAAIAELIERTAERLHWILISRSTGDFPIASWLAYEYCDFPIEGTELAFTHEEIEALAADIGASQHDQLAHIAALTGGWPAAVSLALYNLADDGRLDALAAPTHEHLYAALCAETLRNASPDDRRTLLATALCERIDVRHWQALGTQALGASLEHFAATTPFVRKISEHVFAYHELFRESLIEVLRTQDDPSYNEVLEWTARAYCSAGEYGRALRFFSQLADQAPSAQLLEAHGFDIVHAGYAGVVLQALDGVRALLGESMARALRAAVAFGAHDFTLARSMFNDALEKARGDLDLQARLLVACIPIWLAETSRAARESLEAVLACGVGTIDDRATLHSTCAVLAAKQDRVSDFAAALAQVERLLPAIAEGETQIALLSRCGEAAFIVGDRAAAEKYARRSLTVASAFRQAAPRAHELFVHIANERDDPQAAREALEKVEHDARLCGDVPALRRALAGRLELAILAGDDETADSIEFAAEGNQRSPEIARVLAARAMRLAWQREFAAASVLLADALDRRSEDTFLLRALRTAEASFYAACDDPGAGSLAQTLADSHEILFAAPLELCPMRARILFNSVATTLLRGEHANAHALLRAAGAMPEQSERTRALLAALRVWYVAHLSPGGWSNFLTDPAMAALDAAAYGGYKRLLYALPVVRAESGLALLSGADIALLRDLALGGSTKEIAAATRRSASAVDSQIKTITEKLGVNSRSKAVALALEHWIVRVENRPVSPTPGFR